MTNEISPIKRAVQIVGYDRIAAACGVTRYAVVKWTEAGHLPRTDWTGESGYSYIIESLTERQVTRAELLSTRGRKAA